MYIRESSNLSWNEELRVEEVSIKTMKRKAQTKLSKENLESMTALRRRSRSKTPQLDQARIPHYKKLKACGISASIGRVSSGLKELAVEEVVMPFESGALKQP